MHKETQEQMRFFYFTICLLLPLISVAQRQHTKKIAPFYHLKLNLGASSYFGDMDSGDGFTYVISDLLFAKPAASVAIGYNHNKRFTTELSLLIGGLKGDDSRSSDAGRLERNLNFHSPYYEIALMEELNVLGSNTWFEKDGFVAYVKAGIAGYYFNPKTKDNDGAIVELQPLGTEGQGAPGYDPKYSLYRFCIPFGVGLKYKLNNKSTIGFEMLSRYTYFDYIDDLAGTYAPKEVLLANGGEKAVELSDRRANPTWEGKRGQLDSTDYVFSYMITYSIRFTKGSKINNPK